jgi:signal peptidase
LQIQQEEFLTPAQAMAEAPPPVEKVHVDLAAEVLRRSGEVRFVARGSSMLPAIYPGDVLTVHSESLANIRCGEIVLCFSDGRFRIHRLARRWIEAGRLAFATQGDALVQEDPRYDESQLLGRVTAIVRLGQPISFLQMTRLSMRMLRWAVRRSDTVAHSLLRRHLLRTRLLRGARGTADDSGEHLPEAM